MLWPALLFVVLAFVVADFVRHPYLGAESQAAIAPRAHLTLWLASTEATGESGAIVRGVADSLILFGRPATVGLLAGGSSRAASGFLAHPQAPGQLLAVSSETLANLAQERTSLLTGEEPLRAALAQRLLARAVPIGVLGGEPLTIAVLPQSPVRNVGSLFAQLRVSAQSHVFAITDDNWDTDVLAALVQDSGVQGIVPYRVASSSQDASLALAAGSADVLIAPRGALQADIRVGRLRALAWPAAAGRPPRSWLELLAAPGVPRAEISLLRRQVRALARSQVLGEGSAGSDTSSLGVLGGRALREFLSREMARVTELQQVAIRVERH